MRGYRGSDCSSCEKENQLPPNGYCKEKARLPDIHGIRTVCDCGYSLYNYDFFHNKSSLMKTYSDIIILEKIFKDNYFFIKNRQTKIFVI